MMVFPWKATESLKLFLDFGPEIYLKKKKTLRENQLTNDA